jgi:hypothetical protein
MKATGSSTALVRLNRNLSAVLLALALAFSGAVGPVAAATSIEPGSAAGSALYKKKCKKGSKKRPKNCKGNKRPPAKKPWVGSPYRPGQVCSLAPHMQKKYKRYGLFCLDLGLGIWSLEPL